MGDEPDEAPLDLHVTLDLSKFEDDLANSTWKRVRLALYTIVDEIDGNVVTSTGEPFDLHAYSRFKYGCHQQAAHYGDQLTKLLVGSPVSDMYRGEQPPIIVSASAYKRLYTAAQLVANTVESRLRWASFQVQAGRIYRAHLTEGDYGAMTHAQRQYWMTNNGLSVDPTLFVGRHVIVVDDVRITGSHERAIWRLFADLPIRSLTNLYVVELSKALVERDPCIEDRMNHAEVRTLHDLIRLMWQDSYVPTARTVKFVLSRPYDALVAFLAKIEGGDLRALHMGVLDDGYYAMQTYHDSCMAVFSEVEERKYAAAKRGYTDMDDRYWRDWNPQPYCGPVPGMCGPLEVPPVPTLPRVVRLPFGYRLTRRPRP